MHVRFQRSEQELDANVFRILREIFHEHPGETPVVLHIPIGPGRSQRMDLRVGVAYDSELIGRIARAIGEQAVEVSLE
jgi:hypothetical protein